MANASPTDVRAGWEIFRRDPNISLVDLNRELERRGHGEVHDRSIRHYRSLLNAGFDRYVSVNRFDVARAARPYEGASATPRYLYYGTQLPVTVKYARKSQPLQVAGTAERVGEVGAVIRFTDNETVAWLDKNKPTVNTYVTVVFESYGESFLARVIDSEINGSSGLVEVEFTRVQSISELTGASNLGTSAIRMRLASAKPNDRAADLIGRRIYYAMEAIEASRAITNDLLTEAPGDPTLRMVDPPELRQLRYHNPIELVIVAPPAIATGVLTAWFLLKSGLKTSADFYGQIQSAHVDRAISRKIEAEARRIDAETQRLAAPSVQLPDGEDHATMVVLQVVRQELGLAPKALGESPNERQTSLSKDLFEAARGLERQEVEGIDVHVNPPSDAA